MNTVPIDTERLEIVIKTCNSVLEKDSKDALALDAKADALSKLGKFIGPLQFCDKALKINSKYADTWITKGNNLKYLGKYRDAIQCYDKALEVIREEYGGEPIHEMVFLGIGECKKLLKQQSTESKK